MKNVLVIGNGFDIAHGLYTKYIDFYNFCNAIKRVLNDKKDIAIREDIKEELLRSEFMKSTANIINNKKIVNDDMLEKMINICKNNYWLNCIEERNLSNDPHWCDIEGVIADEISKLSYVAKKYDGVRVSNFALNESNEIINIYQHVMNYASKSYSFKTSVCLFKEKLLSDLNDLTWMLEIYLSKFLNRKSKTYKFFETLNIDYIINFNYTDTYNKLYKKNIPTHFIHGKIRNNDKDAMNMVFGIGDSINEDDNNYEFIEFQKYYQRIIYKTGNDYAKWLDNNEIMNIFIFGHSVNEVDGDIIKRLITRKYTNIYIYYYDQPALNSIVANLTRILGKETIIDYTNKNKIVFLVNDLSNSFNISKDPLVMDHKELIEV
ncbi:AbiH family protein [Thomasclavelia sp.]|uniref:AbiH family protein n=1 Tax=Thomasclavelia sp. TaxID=3025757 RepID=UPI00261BF1CA|nr:AbiH family protein [Thomasclavelia sp.]